MRFLFVLWVVGILGACASTRPTSFNPEESKALNIARAAGIDAKLKDVEVPKDTVNNITDSAGFGFAMAASGYKAPISGFSPNQMAAMNFTAWLFSPKADSARNSFFAWMPNNFVGDPVGQLSDIISNALIKAENDLGYKVHVTYLQGKSVIYAFLFKENDPYCGTPDKCFITFGIREPKRHKDTPTFVAEHGSSFFFDPSARSYSLYSFSKKYQGFNEVEILTKLSKFCPSWMFFYAAPNKLRFDEDKPLTIPLMISQGKVMYFIKPKA